jgi:hypothetical protein
MCFFCLLVGGMQRNIGELALYIMLFVINIEPFFMCNRSTELLVIQIFSDKYFDKKQ